MAWWVNMNETRSLMSTGRGSLMVTIPATWIQEHHLEKGDLVELDWDFDSITIRPVRMVPAE